jgi:histidyl-tRNA synthetase
MSSGALPGFRDFYPDELARRAHIFRAWRAVARKYAFVEYDGPPLEPLDLYTKKSGDEIVGQLYNFVDKGGREVALRPEMTPTFARMVGARANALRKPVKWFSIPQLFRYERAQRGRLREHFQLNVDIVGEASELADAELLAVAIDVMRELGLGPQDVRARVSDRRLLNTLLEAQGLTPEQVGVVYAVLDKMGRQPDAVAREKMAASGMQQDQIEAVMLLAQRSSSFDGANVGLAAWDGEAVQRFQRFLDHCEALGIRDWIDVDFTIVRGLAYYTGTVFELFDAKGELRAICGGGRYDNLLKALGGTDLPALGFGMGDVVLGELLTDRKLWPTDIGGGPEFQLVAGNGAVHRNFSEALGIVTALRDSGFSVAHGLNAERYMSQATRNQVDAARKASAEAVVYFREDGIVEAMSILGKLKDAPTHTIDLAALRSPIKKIRKKAKKALRQWLETQRDRAADEGGTESDNG